MKIKKKFNKHKFNKGLKTFLYIILSLNLVIYISFIIIISSLDFEIPEIETILIYDNNENLLLSFSNGKKKSYVKLNELNNDTINAFVYTEDKRFYDHEGLDFIRIIKAAMVDIIKLNKKEGASTITQQYARNLFLTQDKTFKRKLSEMVIALNLEKNYSKDEILEGYLNSIYFNHGIYGIEDAARFYFNKPASKLTLAESCALAAIPKNPTNYSPLTKPDNNKTRRVQILKMLFENEIIDKDMYEKAINEEIKIYGIRDFLTSTSAPYFCDYILEEVRKLPNIDRELKNGLKVYTSLDKDIEDTANKSFLKRKNDREIEGSIICFNPETGEIYSMIGGSNYEESSLNRVTKTKRQVGSTIKPFVYLTALENGFNLATTFMSEDTTFYYKKESYHPKNFANAYPNMDVSMIYALATSDNMYAVKTCLFLGPELVLNRLYDFGAKGSLLPVPSLALGTMEMSLFTLAQMYQIIANMGVKCEFSGIKYITTFEGKNIYQSSLISKRIAKTDDVYLLNYAMTYLYDLNMTVCISPTGSSIRTILNNKIPTKTGSTDTDYLICGYSKNFACCIWTGYDNNQKIVEKVDKTIAKYCFVDIMNAYFKNHPIIAYEEPSTIEYIDINPITGFYPSFTEYHQNIPFKKNNVPWYVTYNKEQEEKNRYYKFPFGY